MRRARILITMLLAGGLTADVAAQNMLSEMLMTLSGPGGTMSGSSVGPAGSIEFRPQGQGPACPKSRFDGVPVVVSPHEPYVLETGGFAVSAGFATVKFDSFEEQKVDDASGATFLAMDYGLTKSIMIGVTLPWLVDSVDTRRSQGVTGFSDLQLRSRLWATSGAEKASWWDAGFGASLIVPTGQAGAEPSEEMSARTESDELEKVGPGMGAWIVGGDLRLNVTLDSDRQFRLYSRIGGETDINHESNMSGGVVVTGLIWNLYGFELRESTDVLPVDAALRAVVENNRTNVAFWGHYAESFGHGRQQDQLRFGGAVSRLLGKAGKKKRLVVDCPSPDDCSSSDCSLGPTCCPTRSNVPWAVSLAAEVRRGVRQEVTEAPWGAFVSLGFSHRN